MALGALRCGGRCEKRWVPSVYTVCLFRCLYLFHKKKFFNMKKYPTKFLGYYITEDGIVFREPTRNCEKDLIEVGQHLRGGSEKVDKGRCYPSINISIKDENGKFIKQIRYYVHRLVAETFIPNPYGLSEIDHINRDKTNNHVSNLRWITRKDNMRNL